MSDFLACPCCGYSTLTERAVFEICQVCWWEDDGQDDDDAEVVRGGPNGAYSLAKARVNFADHLDMYDAGKGIGAVANPSPERKTLLVYLAAVRQGECADDPRALHGLLRAEAQARQREMQ